MSGVSIDQNPSASSPVDPDWQAAFEGGQNFISRSQHLSQLKAQADASLSELRLGTSAKEALDKAQAALTEAQQKQADAVAMFFRAEAVLRQAESDAAETAKAAKAEADGMIAAAQRTRDEAVQTKAAADQALVAASAERQQLQNERQAAQRLGEQAEQARALYQRKIDLFHAYLNTAAADLAELGAAAPVATASMRAS